MHLDQIILSVRETAIKNNRIKSLHCKSCDLGRFLKHYSSNLSNSSALDNIVKMLEHGYRGLVLYVQIGNSEEAELVVIEKVPVKESQDGIRILAREGIKLVTRADRMNSQGGPLDKIFGVDIIAGNDDKSLQPMVLGNNLVLSMEEMAQILSEVIGTVNDIVINMSKLDLALSTHIHPSPFFGAPTLPSPGMAIEAVASMAQLASVTAFSNAAQKFNIMAWRTKYTKPGAKYKIRSKFNNVN